MSGKTNRLTGEALVEIYRSAVRIKINDEKTIQVLKSGRLAMPYYSPRGQEIIPSALSVCLTDQDYICTIYRGIHDMLAKGLPPRLLWAEIAGRVTGTCKGKGGPMHITYPELGLMVTTGVVGSSLPIANGLAWRAQREGKGRVTVANFGDGAANIGAFHEALNLAGVWKLPVIFVCQNNRYAEHTSFAKSTASERIADRARGYGMPGVRVDGNDVDAMHAAAADAVARARAGGGPTLIEAMTFRFNGHVYGDSGHYIPETEMAAAIAADPMVTLRTRVLAEGGLTEADLEEIDAAITAEIDDAIAYAIDSDFPDLSELMLDVYQETAA